MCSMANVQTEKAKEFRDKYGESSALVVFRMPCLRF